MKFAINSQTYPFVSSLKVTVCGEKLGQIT